MVQEVMATSRSITASLCLLEGYSTPDGPRARVFELSPYDSSAQAVAVC